MSIIYIYNTEVILLPSKVSKAPSENWCHENMTTVIDLRFLVNIY